MQESKSILDLQQDFYCWFISSILVMAYKKINAWRKLILQSQQPCEKDCE